MHQNYRVVQKMHQDTWYQKLRYNSDRVVVTDFVTTTFLIRYVISHHKSTGFRKKSGAFSNLLDHV